ncbi:MAG: ankyrin repeat domain-containing protein [Chitinophagaceae bacterium]
MQLTIKQLIDNKDYKGLQEALSKNPELANEGIPFDEKNTAKAHPLHRICDGVFAGTFSDEEGLEMAKIFLAHGANVNGGELIEKKDTPLLAASSLHADKIALFYIDNGAEINHPGCHGGTALHWAAWCGRPIVVEKLIRSNAALNKKCIDFQATPLFWAVHGWRQSDKKDIRGYLSCIKILVEAGADKTIPNADGHIPYSLAEENDKELKELLR